ncbi:MAG: DUF1178 family protein [bacterium]|nr:DUF1178 family protein [bacterium]
MIIYDLQCGAGHRFEGWFPNQQAFERQKELGLVDCHVCGDKRVEKIISGGHSIKLSTSSGRKHSGPHPKQEASDKEMVTNVDPVSLIKMVQDYIQKKYKDVGGKFPEEIRKMHYGEKGAENIYGTATLEEQESLSDEDIPFAAFPKLPNSFNN